MGGSSEILMSYGLRIILFIYGRPLNICSFNARSIRNKVTVIVGCMVAC